MHFSGYNDQIYNDQRYNNQRHNDQRYNVFKFKKVCKHTNPMFY